MHESTKRDWPVMSKTNSRPSSPVYSTIGPDFEALNTTSSRPSSRRASPKLRSKSPKPRSKSPKPRSKSPKPSGILKPSTRPSSPYSLSTILSTAVSDLARIEAENSANLENQRQISKSLVDLTSDIENLHGNQIENLKSVVKNQGTIRSYQGTIISNQIVLEGNLKKLGNQIESNFDQLWSRLSEIIHKQERITADFNQFEKFKRRK